MATSSAWTTAIWPYGVLRDSRKTTRPPSWRPRTPKRGVPEAPGSGLSRGVRRRAFICALAGAALCRPVGAQPAGGIAGQVGGRLARVGYLAVQKNERFFAAFMGGLARQGYREGTNLVVTEKSAQGNPERLDQAGVELAAMNPDVVVAVGNRATRAAQRAMQDVPIIFASTGDAVGSGLVNSLAAPGGNLTGLSIETWVLNAKRLEALKEAFPWVKRVAVLATDGRAQGDMTRSAAGVLGFEAVFAITHGAEDLGAALSELTRLRADALHVLSGAFFDASRNEIVAFAAEQRLPAIYENRAFAEAGGLMSYGPNLDAVSARAGWYVSRILQGAHPSELPVEQPTHFELVVNLKAAKSAGIDINPILLARADEVIE